MKPVKGKRSTFGWVLSFAGQEKGRYIASVCLAIAGAALQMLPFFVMAEVIGRLLAGDRNLQSYMIGCAAMAGLWLARALLHALAHCLLGHVQQSAPTTAMALASEVIVVIGIIRDYNYSCTRPLPQFKEYKGGQENIEIS